MQSMRHGVDGGCDGRSERASGFEDQEIGVLVVRNVPDVPRDGRCDGRAVASEQVADLQQGKVRGDRGNE